MRQLSRKLQQRNNFINLGIGSASLPPIDYNTALISYSADYTQIQPYSYISTVPNCSPDIEYCTWRVAESNSADYMKPGYLEGAYQLPEFSAQPVTYFGLSGDIFEQNRKRYFLKYYLRYKKGQLESWSGINLDYFQEIPSGNQCFQNVLEEELPPNEDLCMDDFEREYQEFITRLKTSGYVNF